MSLRYLTRRSALNAATKTPVLTNLNHLQNFPRSWTIRRSKHDPKLKSVRPADRIKWWNIVPGDTIRLRGDTERTLHEVLSVNRLSNRVFLKNTSSVSKPGEQPPPSKNYHYSRCQLFVGEAGKFAPKEYRPEWEDIEPSTPVFATRVGISRPSWSYVRHCFMWKRYAVALNPKIPVHGKIRIPWPPRAPRTYPKPSAYDTTLSHVQEVTYQLPNFNPRIHAPLPVHAEEKAYLDYVYNSAKYDPLQPFEMYVKLDLANPHSRAKKLERWKVSQSILHARRKQILEEEKKTPGGRPERQIKADAAFIWRQETEKAKAETKKVRWMHAARAQNLDRKADKKKKKVERQRRHLTQLTLEDEANQVVPKALKARKA